MKRKYFIFLFILISIIVVTILLFINIKNEELKNCTYLAYNSIGNLESGELKSVRMLFVFDKENICIYSKMIWNFNTEELAKENYIKWQESQMSNLKIKNTEVSFYDEAQLGKTKDVIKNIKFGNFEIIEY